MAEGFLRSMAGDRFEAGSAGTERTSVNPLAVRAMAELGIDIGHHTSKQYDDVMHLPWDYVITVCDDAREPARSCPAPQSAALVVQGSVAGHGR
jgi:Protein-tyrosine-phosphatase